MSGQISVRDPEHPKRALIVASNPATSGQTGWPIGFWWAELTHPYWEFVEHGYAVELASPDGGALRADSWSDPRDASGYSADDLLSLGFINSPRHAALIESTKALADIDVTSYDAVLMVGGQGPMYTFYSDERVHELVRDS
jgi:putative intracellular protease/amidase